MRVIVCGSRNWKNLKAIAERIGTLPPGSTIIHGAAKGADLSAAYIAEQFGYQTEAHPADWTRYGKRAGPIRNLEMLCANPDLVIAFWDGTSKGTEHMILAAQEHHIPLEIHTPHG